MKNEMRICAPWRNIPPRRRLQSMVLTRFIYRLALALILIASVAGMVLPQKSPSTTKGVLQRIKIHGKALEGNLEGETADPDVSIYLPPDYETNKNRRYPVIYLLHGYGLTDQYWTGMGLATPVPGVQLRGVKVNEAMDKDIAAGTARE